MICTAHRYCLGDKIGKNRMGGECSVYGGEERRVKGLVKKPEIKRPLVRHNYRWHHNIKMDFQEVGCEYMELIELSEDRDGCGIV